MSDNTPKTVDEILERLYRIAAESEPSNTSGKYKYYDVKYTKQQLYQLVMDVIGEDEKDIFPNNEYKAVLQSHRNVLRAEQHTKLNELFGVKE